MFEIGAVHMSFDKLPEFDLAYLDDKGYTPLNELMRAIILRTIEDLNCVGEVRDEAMAYLFDDSSEEEEDNYSDEYIFSFGSICSHFGIDPQKTREAILSAEHRISTRRRSI